MKISIEKYLYKIDTILKKRSKKDLSLLSIMIVCSIFTASYTFFFDASKKLYDKNYALVQEMQTKVNIDKEYLVMHPESKLTQLDQQIKLAKEEYFMFKDNNLYIKQQIESISSLYYNEKTWGQYLNSISQSAKNNNLKVLNFSNTYVDNHSSFGHVLKIHVKVTGTYKNTLKFINSIEQSFLVVDLHNFSVVADKKLTTDLDISVWGIN